MARFIKGPVPTTGSAKGNSTGLAVIPSKETNERPVAPNRRPRFNSTTNRMEYYDGTGWRNMTPAGTVDILKKMATLQVTVLTTVFTNFLLQHPNNQNSVIVMVGNVLQEPVPAYTITAEILHLQVPR